MNFIANDCFCQHKLGGLLQSFLKSRGFSAIYGLRDSYSGSASKPVVNAVKIDDWATKLGKSHQLQIGICIAVQEIEAWFLLVPKFLSDLSNQLTPVKINEILGFDLSNHPIENIKHPAQAIDNILKTVGLKYTKRLSNSHKIADRLDYETLYLVKADAVPALGRFINQLESALT